MYLHTIMAAPQTTLMSDAWCVFLQSCISMTYISVKARFYYDIQILLRCQTQDVFKVLISIWFWYIFKICSFYVLNLGLWCPYGFVMFLIYFGLLFRYGVGYDFGLAWRKETETAPRQAFGRFLGGFCGFGLTLIWFRWVGVKEGNRNRPRTACWSISRCFFWFWYSLIWCDMVLRQFWCDFETILVRLQNQARNKS